MKLPGGTTVISRQFGVNRQFCMITEVREDERYCVWKPVLDHPDVWNTELVKFYSNFEEFC